MFALQIGAMIFLGYFLIYLVRYNLSVHIVGMAQISNREDRMGYEYNLSITNIKRAGIRARSGVYIQMILN